MKPATFAASALFTSGLLVTSHAQLIPFFTNRNSDSNKLWQQRPNNQRLPPHMDSNSGAMPGIQMPPSNNNNNDDKNTPPTGAVILSDVIGSHSQINIFAGFTRDISTVSSRLDTSDANTTVLAPLNSAISALPRKPWEDPREYEAFGAEAYAGQAGEDRATRNLRRFTEAHVVPVSPWKEGEKVESLNAGGGSVWWEKKGDGRVVVQPGDVEVDRVVSQVANGEVWVLKGVLNYAS